MNSCGRGLFHIFVILLARCVTFYDSIAAEACCVTSSFQFVITSVLSSTSSTEYAGRQLVLHAQD